MPALSPEEVDLALSTLVLRFGEGRVSSAVWKLGANTALAVGGGGPPWGEKQDDALLSALSSLAVLGGLPADTQHTDQWQSALSGLRVVREALATGGKAERQPGHACEPGYAPSTCCKKVRSGQGKQAGSAPLSRMGISGQSASIVRVASPPPSRPPPRAQSACSCG